MTKDEIAKIKDHIEIHARQEPRAIYITEIMWRAVGELEKIADLEKENRLLGERCNQLLKDKGNLTDELANLKETLAQTVENDEVSYETLKLHDQEEIGMLNSKVAELEQQIEEMKCCGNCSHRHYWGNELGCNLDLDKQFECDNNKKKYWEFKKE